MCWWSIEIADDIFKVLMVQYFHSKHFRIIAFYQSQSLRLQVLIEGGMIVADVGEPLIPIFLFLLTHAGIP